MRARLARGPSGRPRLDRWFKTGLLTDRRPRARGLSDRSPNRSSHVRGPERSDETGKLGTGGSRRAGGRQPNKLLRASPCASPGSRDRGQPAATRPWIAREGPDAGRRLEARGRAHTRTRALDPARPAAGDLRGRGGAWSCRRTRARPPQPRPRRSGSRRPRAARAAWRGTAPSRHPRRWGWSRR
jgi:hypothetical protein